MLRAGEGALTDGYHPRAPHPGTFMGALVADRRSRDPNRLSGGGRLALSVASKESRVKSKERKAKGGWVGLTLYS